MLTWIASVPRSGNTLFRMLLHTYSGLPTYSYYNDPPLAKDEYIREAIGHRKMPVDASCVCRLQEMPDAYFVKTHELPAQWIGCRAPAFYIVRDPRAVIVSFFHYQSQRGWHGFDVHHLAKSQWLKSTWSAHVRAWLDAGIKHTVVRYEDMVLRPFQTVRRAAESLGLDVQLNDRACPSFESLHARMPSFFRRGKIDGWRGELSPAMARLLWEQAKDTAMKLGYTEAGLGGKS